MLTGIALILIGCYVTLPKAIAITLIVFGGLNIISNLCTIDTKYGKH